MTYYPTLTQINTKTCTSQNLKNYTSKYDTFCINLLNGECQVHALYKRNVTTENEFQLSTQIKPIFK